MSSFLHWLSFPKVGKVFPETGDLQGEFPESGDLQGEFPESGETATNTGKR